MASTSSCQDAVPNEDSVDANQEVMASTSTCQDAVPNDEPAPERETINENTKNLKKDSRKWCCCPIPNKSHFKKIYSVRIIQETAALKFRENGYNVKAGDALCSSCRSEMSTPLQAQSCEDSSQSSQSQPGPGSQGLNLSPVVLQEECSGILQSLDLPPVETGARTESAKITYLKRKLADVQDKFGKKLCLALNVNPSKVNEGESVEEEDLMFLMSAVKDKIKSVNSLTKIKLLTLCPPSWNISESARFFGVGRYFIKRAIELREEKGILADPTRKPRGWFIPEATRQLVTDFYCQDDNSRVMPGRKDYVSVGKNEHVQKRLVLFNLNELFSLFKKQNPDVKIGFHVFCSLRPKWCVLAGASGTHNVCVCTYHQNLKLKLYALKLQLDINDLLPKLVCNTQRRECMLGVCNKCPSIDTICKIIENELRPIWIHIEDGTEEELNDFMEEYIEYSEWVSVDRSDLVSRTTTVRDLVQELALSLRKVIPHHYTARQQSAYLNYIKENLDGTRVVALMDFGMNYQCIRQDASQGEHWNKTQVTLHPVVVYYKDSTGLVSHQTHVFISDDLKHDVTLVREFQKIISNWLKETLPLVTEVIYMTDGCAAQYRNSHSFLNLCRHKKMFGLDASWAFFATSHGKSPCDGVTGTIKRLAYKASLQRPYDRQIIGSEKVFKFCQEEVKENMLYYHISKTSVDLEREKLAGKRETILTIPGTRSYHHFIPLSGEQYYYISV
ncbi:Cytochrome c biogenesis ATP-binding export protein CcmA [Frankliniella fusca]|uniref:Cytochrome c biogenesis ATP-binding export protein CcmA n=1 Tax=Frankliniella fusca TaxID=407009 RepID=A0AAE1HWA8_9NEOP|nr:Cytochrome c biogenesis ATP-binding export protein CcmA [Frankliniella fusca]